MKYKRRKIDHLLTLKAFETRMRLLPDETFNLIKDKWLCCFNVWDTVADEYIDREIEVRYGQSIDNHCWRLCKVARERNVPFFGICLGMQMACIESARAAGVEGASSTEFGETNEPVVGIITEWMTEEGLQKREEGGDLGGTMRLGAYDAKLQANSHVSAIYGGATEISERHRHRYEVNGAYRDRLENDGLVFSGMSPDGLLPEIVERPDHPWFVGVQFHPELKSRPFDPHPLFAGFVAAALRQSRLV